MFEFDFGERPSVMTPEGEMGHDYQHGTSALLDPSGKVPPLILPHVHTGGDAAACAMVMVAEYYRITGAVRAGV